jgi:uncharacterized membrane protein
MERSSIAATAIFTAFVAAATSLFAVILPLGYFNIGEIMVYTAALLMGPYVGAFAGGVGSMISDLTLGFPQYALGTLAIKGLEGFIVGNLYTKVFAKVSTATLRIITVIVGLLLSVFLAYLGITFLSGSFSVVLGGAWYIPSLTVDFAVPALLWVIIAVAVLAFVLAIGFLAEIKSGRMMLAVVIGGMEMVTGYFLYETFILRLGSYPPTEVPFNVAQALVGLFVSIPVVRSINRIMKGTQPAASQTINLEPSVQTDRGSNT